MGKLVVLMTDFGLEDGSVGILKGVARKIYKDVEIIDLTHYVRKFDIKMGAFYLETSMDDFEPGTIFASIVDPDVGTAKRSPILLECTMADEKNKIFYFVGPNNGLATPLIRRSKKIRAFKLDKRQFWLKTKIEITTFDAKIIFVPVAAKLASGEKPEELGTPIRNNKLVLLEPFGEILENIKFGLKRIVTEVILIDGFGNLITGATRRMIERIKGQKNFWVTIGKVWEKMELHNSFDEIESGNPGIVAGGDFLDYLSIAIDEGNAAKYFEIEETFKEGGRIEVSIM